MKNFLCLMGAAALALSATASPAKNSATASRAQAKGEPEYVKGEIDTLRYHSLDAMPLLGTAAPDAKKMYSRLPDVLHDSIRSDLWDLGQHSAGLSIRFRSNAKNMRARWKSLNRFNMNHMTPVGIRGLDLYVLAPDSSWTWMGSARPYLSTKQNESTIMTHMEPVMREYMLFLSLYDGVDSIYMGVDSTALVLEPQVMLPVHEKPVVMYGTSILHGGCANRPGMAHTNILQRKLNREVINLGFSGNARFDLEIADLMASVDAALYVLDALPNNTAEQTRQRLEPFYQRLRAAKPDTPILIVENPPFPSHRFDTKTRADLEEENAYVRQWYAEKAAIDHNLYFFDTTGSLGDDYEGTVDNAHFTDLGFSRFAAAILPTIKDIID